MFTHCGATLWCLYTRTRCGEMPCLLRKQNSKTKWLFLMKKYQGIIIKMEDSASDRAAWTVLSKCC